MPIHRNLETTFISAWAISFGPFKQFLKMYSTEATALRLKLFFVLRKIYCRPWNKIMEDLILERKSRIDSKRQKKKEKKKRKKREKKAKKNLIFGRYQTFIVKFNITAICSSILDVFHNYILSMYSLSKIENTLKVKCQLLL